MVKFSAGISLIVFFFVQTAFAVNNSGKFPELTFPDWLAPSPYFYSPEGRADPFVPFLQPRVEAEERVELERPPRPLSPLESVEVRQLRLVGIIWDADPARDPSAIVELPDGKGFILKKGTMVGPSRGKVMKIFPDQVLIIEEVTNIYGETVERRTTLELRPGQAG